MTYTYYYGVMCAGKDCDHFISISPYQTNVRSGLPEVDLGDGYPVVCPCCAFRHAYHNPDLVYSQRPDEMVTLDRYYSDAGDDLLIYGRKGIVRYQIATGPWQ
jgi:hypothetical protein